MDANAGEVTARGLNEKRGKSLAFPFFYHGIAADVTIGVEGGPYMTQQRRDSGNDRRVRLTRLFGVFTILVLTLLGRAVGAQDAGSLKITSPAPDAVMTGGDVTIAWELVINLEESHTHIKIDDGRPMVTHKRSKSLKGLKPGQHTVTVWVVDADHQPTGLKEQVNFTVK